MALEVIDLVSSDSDDDISPTKAATSTLQAFGARKEKEPSKENRPIATQQAHLQKQQPYNAVPVRNNTSPSATTGAQNLPPNTSLADLLRYGTPTAFTPRSPALPVQEQQAQRKQTPKSSEPLWNSGPIHEERLRRFRAFHDKETERRGKKPAPQQLGFAASIEAGNSGNSPSWAQKYVAAARTSNTGVPAPLIRRPSSPLPVTTEPTEVTAARLAIKHCKEARQSLWAQQSPILSGSATHPASAGSPALPEQRLHAPLPRTTSPEVERRKKDHPLPSVQQDAAPTTSSVRQASTGAPGPLKRGPTSPLAGIASPEAKRRKEDDGDNDNNEVEITNGMQAARRLSAAAISEASPSDRPSTDGSFVSLGDFKDSRLEDSSGDSEPMDWSGSSEKAESIQEPPNVFVEGTALKKPDNARHGPKAIAGEGTSSNPVTFAGSKESSPDTIPAKPAPKSQPTQTYKPVPPPQPQITQAEDSSPDEIPATAPRQPSFAGREINGADQKLKPFIAATRAPPSQPPKPPQPSANGKTNARWSEEEDDRLVFLREIHKITWEAMVEHFPGRTYASIQVRYSSIKNGKIPTRKSKTREPSHWHASKQITKPKTSEPSGRHVSNHITKPTKNGEPSYRHAPTHVTKPRTHDLHGPSAPGHSTSDRPGYMAPARRLPRAATTAPKNDGMISWLDIKKARKLNQTAAASETDTPMTEELAPLQSPASGLDVAYPASIHRILRSRELGSNGGRSWSSKARLKISDELQNHVFDTLGPRRYFHGAPRDVTCLAWANDGNRFAAGSIATDDESSMQYNGPNNLLLGDVARNSLIELPEHHVPRPIVTNSHNVNSLHAMRETQDPRLFKTVAAVEFSADGSALYSAGGDGVVRMYDSNMGMCLSSHQQKAAVSLLSTNDDDILASACHRSDNAGISIIRCDRDALTSLCDLGPSRADVQSSLPIFPSALKWGSGAYSHLLLAGFASDSNDEGRLTAGEVFLWDVSSGQKIDLTAVRNVFDVAWNPTPSSASSLFAVAGSRTSKRLRSSIQCFAPNQGRAKAVLGWDCPAFDINYVTYCPHDDNLIAAGATDGKVYIWDKRFANRTQSPLHILAHGQTRNVLDHNLDSEVADSGVNFLSWSATGNRLYSGSSDGTVKVWNPYRTSKDALVKDVATFNSAIISGAFSPDYSDLLIGEEQGQLNLLGIDREGRSVRAGKKFDLYPAPVPQKAEREDKFGPARELIESGEIEIKPMGIFRKKQAVQGPNYRGAFLNPSPDDFARLHAEHQNALAERKDASSTMLDPEDDIETDKAIKTAEANVRRVEDAIAKAQTNSREYKILEPLAVEHQKRLRDVRHARKKGMLANAMTRCELDCDYLPTAGDEDGEAPDNHRSQQRIPASLHFQHPPLDASDMTNAEIEEAGLTSKCCSCMGPATKPKRSHLPKCEKCTLTHSGLTARCDSCAVPIRPNLDSQPGSNNVCERCEFHCPRCDEPTSCADVPGFVSCEPCAAVWEAGVLGYELIKQDKKPGRGAAKSHEPVVESLDQRVARTFGDEERERLAGRWRVGLVDGLIEQ